MIYKIFTKKVNGAISLFLTIVMIALLTVNSIIVDGLRYHSGEVFLQGAVDLSSLSVLSNYDSDLLELFGVLALSQDYDTTKEYIEYLETTLMVNKSDTTYSEYIQEFLSDLLYNSLGADDGEIGNVLDLYRFNKIDASVDKLYNLAEPDVLNAQIVEYMKYRAPYKLVAGLDGVPGKGFLETINSFETAQKVSQMSVDKIKVDESISVIMQYTFEASKNIESYNKYNPKPILEEIRYNMSQIGHIIQTIARTKDAIVLKEEAIKNVNELIAASNDYEYTQRLYKKRSDLQSELRELEVNLAFYKDDKKNLYDEAKILEDELLEYFEMDSYEWKQRDFGQVNHPSNDFTLGENTAILNNINNALICMEKIKSKLPEILKVLEDFLKKYDPEHKDYIPIDFREGSEEIELRDQLVEEVKTYKVKLDELQGYTNGGSTDSNDSIVLIESKLNSAKSKIEFFRSSIMPHLELIQNKPGELYGSFFCYEILVYEGNDENRPKYGNVYEYSKAFLKFLEDYYIPIKTYPEVVPSSPPISSSYPVLRVKFEDPMKELWSDEEFDGKDDDFRDIMNDKVEESPLNNEPTDLKKKLTTLENLPSQLSESVRITNHDNFDSADQAYVSDVLNSVLSGNDHLGGVYEFQNEEKYAEYENMTTEIIGNITFEEPSWWDNFWDKLFSFFSFGKTDEDKTFADKSFGLISVMFDGILSILEDGRDNLYINEYVMFTFKNRLTDLYFKTEDGSIYDQNANVNNEPNNLPTGLTSYNESNPYEIKHRFSREIDLRAYPKITRNTSLDAEIEYILKGKDSDAKNALMVYSDIFLIRMATNTGAIIMDAATLAKIRSLSYAVCSYLGIPWAGEIMKWLVVTAWSTAETLTDMDHLINKGYSVYLIKNSINLDKFNLSFDNMKGGGILTLDKPNINSDLSSFLIQYEDYLRVFLFLMPYETKMLRISDLIQLNLQKEGDTDFASVSAHTYIRVDTTASMDFLFLNQPFVGRTIGTDNAPKGKLNLRKVLYKGY